MNNYTSIKEVINNLLNIEEFDKFFNKKKTFDWLGQAIQGIKGGVHLTDGVCHMGVEDHLSSYPDGFMRIRNIYYCGMLLTRDQTLLNRRIVGTPYVSSEYTELLIQLQARENIINEDWGNDAAAELLKLETLNKCADNITWLAAVVAKDNRIVPCVQWFDDNPTCIKYSFEKGDVVMDYVKFAVDDEGYPLVYDDFNYKECLFFYALKMFYLSRGKHDLHREYDNYYNKYKHKAQNGIKLLDELQMDYFVNQWTNLLLHSYKRNSIFTN